MRILFFHGLESGPNGTKARWLAERYGAVTPHLGSEVVAEPLMAGRIRFPEEFLAAAAPCVQVAREALVDEAPDIVVGSSFGGAIAVHLAAEGRWKGPLLLLACASRKLLGDVPLPKSTKAVLVHGRQDDVVPLDHARWLAAKSGPRVMLWEVADDHRLGAQLGNGVLDAAIGWLARA